MLRNIVNLTRFERIVTKRSWLDEPTNQYMEIPRDTLNASAPELEISANNKSKGNLVISVSFKKTRHQFSSSRSVNRSTLTTRAVTRKYNHLEQGPAISYPNDLEKVSEVQKKKLNVNLYFSYLYLY